MFPLRQRPLCLTIIVICMMAWLSHAQFCYNQETSDFILKIHNRIRSAVGGCRINKLENDEELEEKAKNWTERCEFKHREKDGYGENLGLSTSKKNLTAIIAQLTEAWAQESSLCNHQTQTRCGDCCHYSQIVWSTTVKLGCYITRCPLIKVGKKEYKNAWFLACFYTPRGNNSGKKAYEIVCETKCMEGQIEENGLCAGAARD
uniref:SCP domain-containing protein n=1 Tax=Arion vulgaris TaxID=1028688 RepID=A0A0B7BHQ5_9EUPU